MELAEQVQEGYVAVFPLEAVTALQKLWLSPVAVIPQVGRMPRLIIDFTWSGLNDIVEHLSPMEAMRFGGALQRILRQVITIDPRLGLVYLSKVDLDDSYMRSWMMMEDVPYIAFLIPKKTPATRSWWGFTSPSPWGTSVAPHNFA